MFDLVLREGVRWYVGSEEDFSWSLDTGDSDEEEQTWRTSWGFWSGNHGRGETAAAGNETRF